MVRQHCFVIFRFFLTSSHRQPFAHAQYPISHHPIRILRHPRQSPGAGDQIDFQFLSIKIRIIPPHDPPFHQKRTGSGDKGSGKGCSGDRGIASTGSDCRDIHPPVQRSPAGYPPVPGESRGRKRVHTTGLMCHRRPQLWPWKFRQVL